MKFTLNWLKQPLNTTATAHEIAEKLTSIGHEVEEVIDNGALLAPFTIAHIKSTVPHPNADRLKVCTVWTGTEELQIVCGAPNARAGINVVLSRPGDFIPGLGITLKKSKIRDVESQGMLCSAAELGLPAESSDGIMELPDDAPVGGSYKDYAGLDDVLFDVALTPNRGDCASVYGIARDLAASGIGTLRPIPTDAIAGAFDSPITLATTTPMCPHIVGRYIRGVKNIPSPPWLQQIILSIGLRPISALVDLTNFFTHDLGRPLHVYDADKIGKKITARAGAADEELAALNGKTYALNNDICVIADEAKALGVGGIIGGIDSGCTEATVNVFIESAWFQPGAIARAGRALACISDARYRFERGVDPMFTAPAIELATKMILEICGGTPSNVISAGNPVECSHTINFDPLLTNRIIGADIPVSEQTNLLRNIGCTINGDNVMTPSWRGDLVQPIDLVEEIARLRGLNKITPAYLPPLDEHQPYKPHAVFSKSQRNGLQVKYALAAMGYQECVTYSFLPEKHAQLFGDVPASLRLTNPISLDLAVMRPSILPNLLAAAARNAARGIKSGALFELGPVFQGVEADQQPVMLGGVRFGEIGARHWRGAHMARTIDAFDMKADVMQALHHIGMPVASLKIAPARLLDVYHPGQSAELVMGREWIARFGVVHPQILDAFDIKTNMAAFEMNWPAIIAFLARKKDTPTRAALSLPDLQAVTRDFAFLAPNALEAGTLMAAIKNVDKALITDVRVFDLFAGKGIPDGYSSIALEVTLQPIDKTLDEAALQTLATAIIAAAAGVGAQIRS